MSARLSLLDGRRTAELVDALGAALAGKARELTRLAEREGLDASGALVELGAFPARDCAALSESLGLALSECRARAGCPVDEECPLVRGENPEAMKRSALAALIEALFGRFAIDEALGPAAPSQDFDALREGISRLLAGSDKVGPDAPPRARTSLMLLDLAARRGAPLGVGGAFLSAAEVEQLAAFLPPGSGRHDPALLEIEALVRRAVLLEAALVERRLAGGAR